MGMQNKKSGNLEVVRCSDFVPDGSGHHAGWKNAGWVELNKLEGGSLEYRSRFKMMYSAKGIYVLFSGEDERITSDYTEDQSDMYNADVFEVFFHPDTRYPIYLEYEVNALDRELVILVPNIDGKFLGWQPWHYEKDRKIVKAVRVEGGLQEPFAEIDRWTAEIFFPYEIFDPLIRKTPQAGDVWKGNFYRLDYDDESQNKWSWMPVKKSFHEFERFGTLIFK
jgi:hypothetical protein